jgi:hypothetical protein
MQQIDLIEVIRVFYCIVLSNDCLWHGAWGMEHGAWSMGQGAWGKEQGFVI